MAASASIGRSSACSVAAVTGAHVGDLIELAKDVKPFFSEEGKAAQREGEVTNIHPLPLYPTSLDATSSLVVQPRPEQTEVQTTAITTLVYFGALLDLNIPLFAVNILIDKMPEYDDQVFVRGPAEMFAGLMHVMQLRLPGSLFTECKERRLWQWTTVDAKIRVLYFHGYRYGTDAMPVEVKGAHVQMMRYFYPGNWEEAMAMTDEELQANQQGWDWSLTPSLLYFHANVSTTDKNSDRLIRVDDLHPFWQRGCNRDLGSGKKTQPKWLHMAEFAKCPGILSPIPEPLIDTTPEVLKIVTVMRKTS